MKTYVTPPLVADAHLEWVIECSIAPLAQNFVTGKFTWFLHRPKLGRLSAAKLFPSELAAQNYIILELPRSQHANFKAQPLTDKFVRLST